MRSRSVLAESCSFLIIEMSGKGFEDGRGRLRRMSKPPVLEICRGSHCQFSKLTSIFFSSKKALTFTVEGNKMPQPPL